MPTKIMATLAEDSFGDYDVTNQIRSDYLLVIREVAEELYGEDVEIDVDFEPTNLRNEWFAETDGEPSGNFDGNYFGALVWDRYCRS